MVVMDMVRSGTEPSEEAPMLPSADGPVLGSVDRLGQPPTADPLSPRERPTHDGQWEPLAGAELLSRLRFTGRPRPAADPDRRRRLRNVLESGLGTDSRPAGLPPMVITRGRLTRILDGEPASSAEDGKEPELTTALACGALLDVLFRQLITIGVIDDPVIDGLSALAVDRRNHRLVTWIGGLSDPDRRELETEVRRQADELARRWPRLEPGWFPRTGLRLRTGLADGTVILSARADLAVGQPAGDRASVALVDVTSGARHRTDRHDRRFMALVETLRSPAPPFVVATYYTRTGELDVDPVTDELLEAAAHRVATGIGQLVTAAGDRRFPLGGVVSGVTP
jgi:hypothetical protein